MPEFVPPSLSIVNVSQVKKLSPFRYPGGKTWLVPYARQWLQHIEAEHLYEPFAGGASISLMALDEDLVEHATIVELDENVAAVWQTILGPRADDFAEFILDFQPTPDGIRDIMESAQRGVFQRACRSILLNRCTRGGIMADGVGLLKRGENGKGITSRWYADTLAKRVRRIHGFAQRLHLVRGDGIAVMRQHSADDTAAFFIDPPYTVAGRRLYTHWEVDHRALFRTAMECDGSVLMTYDDTPEVRQMADEVDATWALVPMKSTHHEVKNELLISFDVPVWLQPFNGN